MSRLKTGVPAPHPPPGSERGQDGGERPKRGDGVRESAGLEDSVCSSPDTLIKHILSYTWFIKIRIMDVRLCLSQFGIFFFFFKLPRFLGLSQS